MSKIHVNPETGAIGSCKAGDSSSNSKGCPFGGESGADNHFDNRADALAYSETLMENEHGKGLFGVKKKYDLVEGDPDYDVTKDGFDDLKNEDGNIILTNPDTAGMVMSGMRYSALQSERRYRKEVAALEKEKTRIKPTKELELEGDFREILKKQVNSLNPKDRKEILNTINRIGKSESYQDTSDLSEVYNAVTKEYWKESIPESDEEMENLYQIEKTALALNSVRGDNKFKTDASNVDYHWKGLSEDEIKSERIERCEDLIKNDPATKKLDNIKGFFLKKASESEEPGSNARFKYAEHIAEKNTQKLSNDLSSTRWKYSWITSEVKRIKVRNYIAKRTKEDI